MLTRRFFPPLHSPLPSRSSVSRNLKSPSSSFLRFHWKGLGECEVGNKNKLKEKSALFPSSTFADLALICQLRAAAKHEVSYAAPAVEMNMSELMLPKMEGWAGGGGDAQSPQLSQQNECVDAIVGSRRAAAI